MKLLILSFLLKLSFDEDAIALAFSMGAGGCDPGGAVSGLHLSSPTTGALALGNFQLVLDGTPLVPNEVTPVTASQMYKLSIQPIGDATFRGALMRVEDQGTTLMPGENSVQATACVEAAGLTHASNELKTTFEATIQVEAGSESIVEVTVVVSNSSPVGSIYYYDQFTLTTTQAATPVATPTMGEAPVAMAPTAVEAPVAMAPMMVEAPVPETPTMVEAPVAMAPMMVETPVAETPSMVEAPVAMTPSPSPEEPDIPVGVEPTFAPDAVAEPTGAPVTMMEPTATTPIMQSPVSSNTTTTTPTGGNMTANGTAPVLSPARSPVRSPTMPTTSSVSDSFSAITLLSILAVLAMVAIV